jgi:Fe-S cluster assembly ATP-binding protein
MNTLEIKNLNVSIEGQRILKTLASRFQRVKSMPLMGPNGTGKSTLAKVMAGHEDYEV